MTRPLQRDHGLSGGEEAGDTGQPIAPGHAALHIVGLVLACGLVLGLWLRAGGAAPTPDPSPAGAREGSLARALAEGGSPPSRNGGEAGGGGRAAPALLSPYDLVTPNREPLAGLPGARERFGPAFRILHPAYLPAGLVPFAVNWQPDSDPRRRADGAGELLTWFYSAEHGAVLVLAQGPGVGVWPTTAGADRAGRLRLADGAEVIWVIGHPVHVSATAHDGPEWRGTEITLGVPLSEGEGWYLRSPILSLAELIRVAESLRPYTGATPAD